ncbi:bifunctional UDP-sugar hydrolase/5'-nucleotidase [Rhodoplanes sp. TEM]|uniref:Bifunctional UDP-sugar hydrolase/5'-nucleotidase n=1 Tax=Rhodoplanes tepidamans TaxID=200616 RepID=A0ABT5J6A4_RHOTP|nr:MULTISPECIES: bifunctional UDP-sugar hydrolase/5'-nucleotidase [Rhodoplanes]MDC7785155.1 bifunctional UDP-sugar hydrolase/5'-nucleotidase [Rhodoplanes tepidamans]MDC7982629.1 bifunctional UDP-sugar hydrolase/5'-nucleotidase [Rhodoplanes sp. TEM]MDQ0356647.1 2',3'-cyclic-nucleotide 2'-phosphodiesterase (5'-nucleotidase family) [Rhodoplanes tepidamans]
MSCFARLTTRAVLLAALAVLIALPAHAAKITFVLVNDIYEMADQETQDGRMRGGFARLAAVVKAERARAAAGGGTVIFAHAGDTLSPSLMSGLDQGAHIVALTNMVAPDIFVPGNHEFDFGKAVFLKRMGEARFPLFAANLRAPGNAVLPGFQDRRVVTVDGVKIGLLGLAYDDTARASNPEDLVFRDSVEVLKEQAAALRREGADFVVAVVHADRDQQRAMVATGVVDVVLGGHNHDLFINYDQSAALVESSYEALYVTAVDVDVTVTTTPEGRRAMAWWPQFRIVDTATVTPDPEVLAAVKGYQAELASEMNVPIATTAVEWDSRSATVRTREAAIGNVFADAVRANLKTEAAILNGGGIRSGRVYPPGSPVTRRDVLAELPFSNRVVPVEIGGAELRAAIEHGLAKLPDPSGRFPQVSGLTVEADPSKPPGSRVLSIQVDGRPLDPRRTYTVAVNDFMARGGDGYDMVRDAKHLLPTDDSPLLANEVMVHLRRLGTMRTGVEGRIRLK